MIDTVESGNASFKAILVYDISRWGRFQDADESAFYEYLCKRAGIEVHYCAEQFENGCAASLRDAGLLPIWSMLDAFPYGDPTDTLAWEQPAYYESATIGWLLLVLRLSLALTLFELLKDGVKWLRKQANA